MSSASIVRNDARLPPFADMRAERVTFEFGVSIPSEGAPTYLTGLAVKKVLWVKRNGDENLDRIGRKVWVFQFVGWFIDFDVALLDERADGLYFVWFVATRVTFNVCVAFGEPLHCVLLYGC